MFSRVFCLFLCTRSSENLYVVLCDGILSKTGSFRRAKRSTSDFDDGFKDGMTVNILLCILVEVFPNDGQQLKGNFRGDVLLLIVLDNRGITVIVFLKSNTGRFLRRTQARTLFLFLDRPT